MRQLGHIARTVAAASLPKSWIPPPRSAKPILATLNLTENCQSRCVMCDYWQENKASAISTQRATSLVKELAGMKVSTLRFLGGEPLLRKDLFEVLRSPETASFKRITLATNGLLLERMHRQVDESPISNITVSIDGCRDTHDKIRGIPGGFDQIMDGLRLVKDKRVKVVSLVTKHLAGDIEALLMLCKRNGWDFDLVLPSFDLPFAKRDQCVDALTELWPSSEETDHILEAVVRAARMSPTMAAPAKRYLEAREYPQSSCVLGFVQLQIRSNGDLLSGCYELEPMGNILHRSVREILNSEEYQNRIRQMFRMDCPGCVCGWQISFLAGRPLGSLAYVRRRLSREESVAPPSRAPGLPGLGNPAVSLPTIQKEA